MPAAELARRQQKINRVEAAGPMHFGVVPPQDALQSEVAYQCYARGVQGDRESGNLETGLESGRFEIIDLDYRFRL